MSRTKYSLTDAHRAQLKPWADRAIANVLRTEPMTDSDREAMRAAMSGLYRAANLVPPERCVFVDSPITGAIAASIAAGAWWIREHHERHVELFGQPVTEADLMGSVRLAIAHAVPVGMHAVRRDDGPPPRRLTPTATRDVTDADTDAATVDATDVATYSATNAATRVATAATTGLATYVATAEATRGATFVATSAATSAATKLATDLATRDATSAATSAATKLATDLATRDATSVDTSAAAELATDLATRVATRVDTRNATEVATSVAIDRATDRATALTTALTTDLATFVATGAAAGLPSVARFLVGCLHWWSRLSNGGNMWSGWVAYLSFFRHICKLDLPEYEKFQHYEAAAMHGGPRFLHSRFWIVSDFPTTIGKDTRHRPHCETGPHLAWRDGWALYAEHGVPMPAWVYECPDRLTVARIDAEANAEVRRILIGRYGIDRYMRDAGAEVLDEDLDELGLPRRLLVRRHADGGRTLAVHVCNSTLEPDGTRRQFWLRVDPQLRPLPTQINGWLLGAPQELTARNAVASTFGLTGPAYAPDMQT